MITAHAVEPETARPLPRGSLPESPRQFLRRLSIGHVHKRIAEALASEGFHVRTVLRVDSHPVWKVTMVRPRLRAQTLRKAIHEALAVSDGKPCPQDVEVLVEGDRVTVTFIWEAATPPGFLGLYAPRNSFFRQVEDGSWKKWKL